MCAVVRPVSPLPIQPSSTTITFLPDFERRYVVVIPAIPPPTTMTSATSPEEEEEEILYVNLPNRIGCSMLAYQEGSLSPDVLFSQLFLLLSLSSCLIGSSFVFICGCLVPYRALRQTM